MWGLEKLTMDADDLFSWLQQRDYCESAYDGRIRMTCDVIKQSILALHDAQKRRRSITTTFPYLEEDDEYCRDEVKRIRKQLQVIKEKVGYTLI